MTMIKFQSWHILLMLPPGEHFGQKQFADVYITRNTAENWPLVIWYQETSL